MINSSRAPPRPTPSMVNYSDEDSAKGYDENPDDSDSLTEKPSEISSTDSQVEVIRYTHCTVHCRFPSEVSSTHRITILRRRALSCTVYSPACVTGAT